MSKVIIKYIGWHMPKGEYEVTEEHALSLEHDPNWVVPALHKPAVKEQKK